MAFSFLFSFLLIYYLYSPFLLLLLFLSLVSYLLLVATRYLSVTCSVSPETLAPRRTSCENVHIRGGRPLQLPCNYLFNTFCAIGGRKQDCRGNYLPKRYSCQLLHTFKSTLLFLWQSALSTTCLRSHPHVVESKVRSTSVRNKKRSSPSLSLKGDDGHEEDQKRESLPSDLKPTTEDENSPTLTVETHPPTPPSLNMKSEPEYKKRKINGGRCDLNIDVSLAF